MMNAEQARAVAEEYFNGARPEPAAVGLHAFPGGYVAWVKDGPREDPAEPPGTIGGGCVVIDAGTGEVSMRPLLDPRTTAEQWPGPTPR
ncbi:hypothetical protein [Thermoactinospora rubra]|uniref:hypothetical protein n=1 Tax=Thermoactinospora rubra TaxID=1088767 RepID=UPI001F0B2DD7|nr:hypothetical protein [Thermoactinospora rubra]